MKKQLSIISLMLSLFVMLMGAPLRAEFNGAVTANIPFEFVAGNTTFPAGEYTLNPIDLVHGTLLIQRSDGHKIAFLLTNRVQTNKAHANAELVFNRYNDQYFLSEVWMPETTVGRQLTKSPVELELEKTKSEPQVIPLASHRR